MLWLLLTSLLPACASPSDPQSEALPFAATLEARTASGEPARTFSREETIELLLTIRNRTQSVQSFTCPSAQIFDFAVHDERGLEIWRWSRGRMFAQVLTPVEWSPGEAKTFRVRWQPRESGDRPAPAGELEVSAWLASGRAGTRADAVKIRLR